ncbi:hypothetical protein ABH930_000285 [Kitasatospora sp. GAS204A]|uniref:hypothetical protein n=1 Tax=unclassified Kitasatospora TaxID=2633591 RepID=UPI00247507E2|nr:hypothetical protein [Kitasatospora sp. GAS204B]MDH6116866.1 hypothetical protein [Kitasatospora sp. GAS204B]
MPHPKLHQIRRLIDAGLTNTAIGQQLHVERQTVGRIRHELGLPLVPRQPLTVEEKWRQRTRELPGGHLEWTGDTSTGRGVPVLRHSGQTYTAGRVAFRIQHGADPTGHAKPDCGVRYCVAPAHQYDTAARQPVREPLVRYNSAEAKLAALTEATPDGHLAWAGPTTADGRQILTHGGVNHTAARVAFRARWGREPIGVVLPSCEYPRCLLGEHLDDTKARNAYRAMFSAVFGRTAA